MGTLPCFLLLLKISPEAIIFLWIMAIFPDIDIFVDPFTKKRNLYFLSHKAASHSYIIGIIISGIIAVPISLLRGVPFIEVWVAGVIGFSIHVSLDFFGASRVPVFYPLSKKEFRVIADRAINPILALFSGINLLVLIIYYYIKPYYHVFMSLTSFYIYTYLIYFGIKLTLRIIVQIRLEKQQQYIPGIFPLFYFIYEKSVNQEGITIQLTKKFAFSSKQKGIINHHIMKNSENMVFFELAENISQEYRFFHKWNSIIPFFQNEDNLIHVVLILAESYFHSSSYFFSIIFEKDSYLVKYREEGFGSFKKWKHKHLSSIN
jgi:membrane-bound metal-dependent hydrolase YbcI (DUF457 family)